MINVVILSVGQTCILGQKGAQYHIMHETERKFVMGSSSAKGTGLDY